MKLTEKDKKLLYVLCVLVIAAVFGFFVIKPQLEKREELSDMLAEAESRKSSMDVMVATAPASETIIEQSTEAYNELVEDFYPLMNSNQMEAVITEMVLSSNLTAMELDVSSQPEQADVAAYFASTKAQQAILDGETGQTDGSGSSGDTASGAESQNTTTAFNTVYRFKVSATASGAEADMKGLVDKICADCPAIRITGFKLDTRTGISAGNEVRSVTSLVLDMEVYMAVK